MKVLQLIHSGKAERGGPIEGASLLRQQLRSRGHTVQQVTLDDTLDHVGSSEELSLGPGLGKYGFSLRFRAWLVRHVASYDVVVVHGLWQFHLAAAASVLREQKVPYLVFCHGMLDPWFNTAYPLKRIKKQLYWWLWEYRALRDARHVLFTCDEERLLARESFAPYRVNELVLGYGTLTPDIDRAACHKTFLDQFPKLRNRRAILFLGRLHPKKGCDLLIEAFAKVAGEHPDLDLIMAGPDEVGLQSKLQQLAQKKGVADRVHWVGMLRGSLKWGAILHADVFALPSHQENFGIAVAESLALGVPVLISNKVNIWREIEQDRAGFVGEDTLKGTEQSLRRWLAADIAQRAGMRENALACFSQHFDFKGVGERFHALMTSLD